MTIKELIIELSKYDENSTVLLDTEGISLFCTEVIKESNEGFEELLGVENAEKFKNSITLIG